MDPQSWNEDYAEKILGRKKPEIPKSSVEDLIPSNPEVKCEVDPMELGPNTSQDNSEIVEDVLECKLTDPLTTSSAQFSCSECQATFDTREKCMNHRTDVHSAKGKQCRGGLKQELHKCERWYVEKCREIAMAPREVCSKTLLSSGVAVPRVFSSRRKKNGI